jgi:Tfp pilus assembly protein PilO
VKNSRYSVLAFGLVAAVFIFQYAFLTPRMETMRDTIQTSQKALLMDEQFLLESAKNAGGLDELVKNAKNIETRMLDEKSAFLDSAKLQGEVSGIAGTSGLKVTTIRPLTPGKLGNFSVISIYFEGNGDIRQVSDFLKGIEQDKLLIKVDKLNITITNVQNPKELKYKIQVSALAKKT